MRALSRFEVVVPRGSDGLPLPLGQGRGEGRPRRAPTGNRTVVAHALLVAMLLLAVAVPSSAQESSGTPSEMIARLLAAPLPARNPIDLAIRLRGASRAALPTPQPVTTPLPVGHREPFWIVDQAATRTFQVHATLALVTDGAYWFVQDGFADRAPLADLSRSAAVFESQTYPIVRRYFGTEPRPGIDGDPHVVFLLGNVPGVAAYFSGADAYPTLANPRSNQRDMIYVNLNAIRPGVSSFDATLAHEFQHMVHSARCPNQETWVDEGAAELASRVVGYRQNGARFFAARPDVQLNAWSVGRDELVRHYEASYLWWRYVVQRSGGVQALPDILGTCLKGEELFEHALRQRGADETFDQLFADWAVANLLDDSSIGDGRYGYADEDVHVVVSGQMATGVPFGGSVRQYAASYLEVPADAASVRFVGSPTVPVLPSMAAGDVVWWSNRADSLDSTLTRAVDLRGVDRAAARFRVWYDLEEGYDFTYLVASRDGGQSWETLPGRLTHADESVGNGYGVGWTGTSGGGSDPAWVNEEVDLTPFAGQQILLRFECLTDQGYSARGFALGAFEIPELGLAEPDGQPDTWDPSGWVRVDAPLPQQWLLRLVRWGPDGTRVDPVPVDPDGHASFDLGQDVSRAVLVVAPAAPRTLEPGTFTVTAARQQ